MLLLVTTITVISACKMNIIYCYMKVRSKAKQYYSKIGNWEYKKMIELSFSKCFFSMFKTTSDALKCISKTLCSKVIWKTLVATILNGCLCVALLLWLTRMIMMMMMMMMIMINCIYRMVVLWKAFSSISSRYHCQRFSPLQISDTPQAGSEPAQDLSLCFVGWSCVVVISTTS